MVELDSDTCEEGYHNTHLVSVEDHGLDELLDDEPGCSSC